jgi:protein-tyrosine phosphatase
MATVVIVDGADVCRAPIVEFTLRKQFAGPTWLSATRVVSRGVEGSGGQRMCDTAGLKLGLSQPATAFFEAHRSKALEPEDLLGADLILTAERTHRAAIVRILPETKHAAFTWKEALVLADAAVDAVAEGAAPRPVDLPALVALLARARGAVPLIEPPVQTAAFHWKPKEEADPLTTVDGHDDEQLHRHTVEESYLVAASLGQRFQELVTAAGRASRLGHPAGRDRWVHFSA